MKVIKPTAHTQKTQRFKRRLALKALGGSALAGGLADKLPAAWQQPLVRGGLLPAHAQASPVMGQIQVALHVANSPDSGPVANTPIAYSLDRNNSGQITHLRIASGQVAGNVPTMMDAIFPVAHAQANNFLVQGELILTFTNSLTASDELFLDFELASDRIICSLRITARLTEDRTRLNSLTATPGQCDYSASRPATGVDSDFVTTSPPVVHATTAAPPPAPRTYTYAWSAPAVEGGGTWSVTGAFTTTAADGATIDETSANVITHTLTATLTDATNPADDTSYVVDVLKNQSSKDGGAEVMKNGYSDFQYVVGQTAFMEINSAPSDSLLFQPVRIGGGEIAFVFNIFRDAWLLATFTKDDDGFTQVIELANSDGFATNGVIITPPA